MDGGGESDLACERIIAARYGDWFVVPVYSSSSVRIKRRGTLAYVLYTEKRAGQPLVETKR